MNRKTNKKVNNVSKRQHLNNPTLNAVQCGEEAPAFDDLQPLFDAHSRRLDDLLRRPEVRPASLNLSNARTLRARMTRAWGILDLLTLADEHSVGLADRCARYRRRVSLRRSTVAALAVVVTVTAFILPPSNGTFVDGSLQCCTADACQRVNVTLTKI